MFIFSSMFLLIGDLCQAHEETTFVDSKKAVGQEQMITLVTII